MHKLSDFFSICFPIYVRLSFQNISKQVAVHRRRGELMYKDRIFVRCAYLAEDDLCISTQSYWCFYGYHELPPSPPS